MWDGWINLPFRFFYLLSETLVVHRLWTVKCAQKRWFWKRTEIAHEMHSWAFTWFLCGLWYMFVLVSICLFISSVLVEVKIILCNMIMQIVSAGGLVLADEIQTINLRLVTLFWSGDFFWLIWELGVGNCLGENSLHAWIFAIPIYSI